MRTVGKAVLMFTIGYTFLFYFMYMGIFPACMSMYHMCAWCPKRPADNIQFSETKIINGYESPSGTGN